MFNLCCICTALPSYKTITFKSWSADPNEKRLIAIYQHNFRVLRQTMDYCAQRGWGLRISSSLMPLSTHPKVKFRWNHPEVMPFIRACKPNIRVSMHPGQFNVLESNDPVTVENTVAELNWHGWLLDQLDCPRSRQNPINLHIHTGKGDFYDLSGRFIRGFLRLDESVKSRLTLENNDKGGMWNCQTLLQFRELAMEYTGNIPLCYDNLHDRLFPSDLSPQECFERFYVTWGDITPIFHHSEADSGNHHADYPTFKPLDYGRAVDWDVELKAKEKAIQKLETL